MCVCVGGVIVCWWVGCMCVWGGGDECVCVCVCRGGRDVCVWVG